MSNLTKSPTKVSAGLAEFPRLETITAVEYISVAAHPTAHYTLKVRLK